MQPMYKKINTRQINFIQAFINKNNKQFKNEKNLI